MDSNQTGSHSWQGNKLRVEIPFSRAGVAHHIWIGGNDTSLLIDAGDGILRDLLAREISLKDIDAILFTHGHFDHMGGLHSLLGFMRMIGRRAGLSVCAPTGCEEVIRSVEMFRQCYRSSTPFELTLIELAAYQEVGFSGLTVTAFPVVHCGSIEGSEMLDRIPACGYRIQLDDEIVAVSGDSGDCEALRALVRDADLAVIEATYQSSTGIDRRVLDTVHLSEDIAAEIGRLAKDYITVHKGRRS